MVKIIPHVFTVFTVFTILQPSGCLHNLQYNWSAVLSPTCPARLHCKSQSQTPAPRSKSQLPSAVRSVSTWRPISGTWRPISDQSWPHSCSRYHHWQSYGRSLRRRWEQCLCCCRSQPSNSSCQNLPYAATHAATAFARSICLTSQVNKWSTRSCTGFTVAFTCFLFDFTVLPCFASFAKHRHSFDKDCAHLFGRKQRGSSGSHSKHCPTLACQKCRRHTSDP